MKIKPIILCGGEGTRLWPKSRTNMPKQFVDFGGWTLFEKTIQRIKHPIFDYPIITTNNHYENLVKYYLKKLKINKYKIILEPFKKNTAPAILASILIKEIPKEQPVIFLPSDHYIDKDTTFVNKFNNLLINNQKFLSDENLFIFGIKPNFPSTEYGYFLTKKNKNKINNVYKFIEKPIHKTAKKIIKKNAYWNSGIFYAKKISIINNFIKYQQNMYKLCLNSISRALYKKDSTILLDKIFFKQVNELSFDYAILEKSKNVNAIKLSIPWSDYGNWREISKINKKDNLNNSLSKNVLYNNSKGNFTITNKPTILNDINNAVIIDTNDTLFVSSKASSIKIKKFHKRIEKKFHNITKQSNVFYRPWGNYINLTYGKGYLIKELTVNPKSSISLQKHKHRSEHWTIIEGKPRITLDNKKFFKKKFDTVYIPKGSIHRIENIYNKPVKIVEVQIGSILKETDIIRYEDVYDRVK